MFTLPETLSVFVKFPSDNTTIQSTNTFIMVGGRKQDTIWMQYDRVNIPGKSSYRAICRSCKKEMQGLVARMKDHYSQCHNEINKEDSACPQPTSTVTPFPWIPKKQTSTVAPITNYITKTSSSEKHAIDL